MKRTRLRPMSAHRREVNAERRIVVQYVFQRDGFMCQAAELGIGPCFGELTPHEVKSRTRAGRTDSNLLDPDGMMSLCAHHNTWCEDNPDAADALGLTMHSWESAR